MLRRVLIVHNRYSSDVPSGENLVVDEQIDGLRARGLDVEVFLADNDTSKHASTAAKARALPSAVWSLSTATRLRACIAASRPSVVHIHNVFPLLSPSVARAAIRSGTPTVWTAHNYRIGCIAATHRFNGAPCDACASTRRVAGIWRGCYSGSRVASSAVTVSATSFRHIIRSAATIAISSHVREWLVDVHGFDPGRVVVISNGIPDPGEPAGVPSASNDVVLVARLSEEKGVGLALDAWARRSSRAGRLLVAGAGPLAATVERAAAADPTIVALGMLASHEVAALLARSRVVLVVPEWQEPFGRIAAEGLAAGRPVVATHRGGLPDIVDESVGRVVAPDSAAIARAIDELLGSDPLVDALGSAARERWRKRFDLEVTLDDLIALYERQQDGRSGP